MITARREQKKNVQGTPTGSFFVCYNVFSVCGKPKSDVGSEGSDKTVMSAQTDLSLLGR